MIEVLHIWRVASCNAVDVWEVAKKKNKDKAETWKQRGQNVESDKEKEAKSEQS